MSGARARLIGAPHVAQRCGRIDDRGPAQARSESSPGAQYQCSNGLSTVANVYELKVTSLSIEGRDYAPSVSLGCKEVAKFSAVYLSDYAAQ